MFGLPLRRPAIDARFAVLRDEARAERDLLLVQFTRNGFMTAGDRTALEAASDKITQLQLSIDEPPEPDDIPAPPGGF